jgi:alanyl-tRNA synthetase
LSKISNILDNNKSLEKELSEIKVASMSYTKNTAEQEAQTAGAYRLIYKLFKNADAKLMRNAAETTSKHLDNLVTVFISQNSDNKISIIVAVNEKIIQSINATHVVKAIADTTGIQGGGGSPTLAQIGGTSDINSDTLKASIVGYLSST